MRNVHALAAALGTAAILTTACGRGKGTQSNTSNAAVSQPSTPTNATQAGTLAVGTLIANELNTNLLGAGLTNAQAQVIVTGANQQVTTTAGTIAVTTLNLSSPMQPIQYAAAAVVQGAIQTLNAPDAGLSDTTRRTTIANIIMGSTFSSLSGRVSTVVASDLLALHKTMVANAVQSLNAAGLSGTAAPAALNAITSGACDALSKSGTSTNVAAAAAAIVSGADENLGAAGLGITLMQSMVAAATSGAVGGLSKAGATDLANAAGLVAQASVASLGSLSLTRAQVLSATTGAASGAVGALVTAGVASAKVAAAAQIVAADAVGGLAKAGVTTANLGATAGAVAAGAIQGLGTAGLTPAQIISTNSVSAIVNGAAGALHSYKLDSISAGIAVGTIAASAVVAIATSSLSSADDSVKTAAVSQVLDGSTKGITAAGLTNSDALSALSVVAQDSVQALPQAGFSASGVGQASASVMADGLRSAVSNGLAKASDAATLAATLGAAVGAGCSSANVNIDASSLVQQMNAAAVAIGISNTSAVITQAISGTANGAALASSNGASNSVLTNLKTAVNNGAAFSSLSTSQAIAVSASSQSAVASAVVLASTVQSKSLAVCSSVFPATLTIAQYPAAVAAVTQPVFCQATSGACPTSLSDSATLVEWAPIGTTGTCTVNVVSNVASADTATGGSSTAVTPGTFTIISAVPGNAQVVVTWGASTNAASYTIARGTATGGPYSTTLSTTASSPYTDSTPSNGTTYYYMVTAVAAGGSISASTQVSATPVAAPGAPSIGTATAGNASASVPFTAPSSNGGSAITSYTVTSSPGGLTGTGASSPITVTGLANGTSYTFSVVATNAVGTGAASAASNGTTPVSAPGAPTIGAATAGNASAAVAFTAPSSNGGSAITSYTVTSSPGGLTGTGASSPIMVSGLTNGTSYTFNVVAINAVGTSTPSAASNSVTPLPAPPTALVYTTISAQYSVATAIAPNSPAVSGGMPTSYTVSPSLPTGLSLAASTGIITGTPSAPYGFASYAITGTNAAGSAATTIYIQVANSYSNFAYVFSGAGNLHIFNQNSTTGALTFNTTMSGLDPDGTPNNSPEIISIEVHPNQKFVYVTNMNAGDIRGYSVNSSTGVLTALGSPVTWQYPDNAAIDVSGRFMYVASYGGGYGLAAYTIDSGTGALTAVSGGNYMSGGVALALAIDGLGRFVYAADTMANTVSAFAINASSGALTEAPGSPFALDANAFGGLASDPHGKFLYVTRNDGTVGGYAIDPASGALSAISGSPFAAAFTDGTPSGLTTDLAGNFLYAALWGSVAPAGAFGYAINASTGALTPIAGSPFASGPNATNQYYNWAAGERARPDPTGKYLYWTTAGDPSSDAGSQVISGNAISQSTGALTALTGSPYACGSGAGDTPTDIFFVAAPQ